MNILLAGNSAFIEEQQEKIKETNHTIIAVATSVAKAADFFHSVGYDAVLLGFELDDTITLLKDFRPKNGVRIWVSVPSITLDVWKKVATIGAIPVIHGTELQFIRNISSENNKESHQEKKSLDKVTVTTKDKGRLEVKTAKIGVLKHRIFSVYSAKGGVGKTTLSTYLGHTIVKHTNLNVCIVDLDHTREGSDIARKFGVFSITSEVPKNIITNFARFPEKEYRSWEKVAEYLKETNTPNLYFLASPWNIEDHNLLTDELIEKVTYILKQHFDIIIFDLSDDIRSNNKKAMELSDTILFISGADIDSIDISSSFVHRTVNKLQLPLEKIRLVLNQMPNKLPYSLEDISHKAGLPLFAKIPEDPELRKPRIEKIAVTDYISSKTPFGLAVLELAKSILPEGSIAIGKKKPWWKRLFSRRGKE